MQKRLEQRWRTVDGKRVLASKHWHFHIAFTSPITGQRVEDRGSTGCGERKDAQRWLDRRFAELERRDMLGVSVDTAPPLPLGDACVRWFEEVGANKKNLVDMQRDLADLCRFIGEDKPLAEIDNNDVLGAMRQRAAEPKRIYIGKDRQGRRQYKAGALPSPATINRQVVEPLRRVMLRARDVWHEPITKMPTWKALKKEEPQGRTREAMGDEFERYIAEIRQDYLPFVLFYTASGRRIREVINMKPELIDLRSKTFRYLGKSRRKAVWKTATLTTEEVAILSVELGKAPEGAVWSYEVDRGKDKGRRRPITYSGFRRLDDAARARAGLSDFRRHDWRHDALTKLVRATGDLAAAQQAAGHADISSTLRYVHARDEDVRNARERAVLARNVPTKSSASNT